MHRHKKFSSQRSKNHETVAWHTSLTALMLLPLLPARGERKIETIPEEILAWMEAKGIPREEQEHLLFSLPDGTQQMVDNLAA